MQQYMPAKGQRIKSGEKDGNNKNHIKNSDVAVNY